MYVTGGVGARSQGEAFGNPYELPNERAYGESCAAIGNMMWNARMLAATGEARFTDVIERALYNGINSGMSLDGKTYCYRNPLAFEPATGDVIRNPWYDTTCCPPNLERTFASLPGYFYSTSSEGVYVHLYDASEMKWALEDGTPLTLTQVTNFPWEGEVVLHVSPAEAKQFTVFVRIPSWSTRNSIRVNGETLAGVTPGQYMPIRRQWKPGDIVTLAFDMSPQLIAANPAVTDDAGRRAVRRGPLVFCMEKLDQHVDSTALNLAGYAIDLKGNTEARYDPALLDGVVVLEHGGYASSAAAQPQPLYRPAERAAEEMQSTTLALIPYYAWANRQPSAMQVWIPYQKA